MSHPPEGEAVEKNDYEVCAPSGGSLDKCRDEAQVCVSLSKTGCLFSLPTGQELRQLMTETKVGHVRH